MIYIDTSCLLKLLRPEPLSDAVLVAVNGQTSVVVSDLVELEALVQLKGAWTGGLITRNQWRQAEARLLFFRNQEPFEFRRLPASLFQTAVRQHRNSGVCHCRSLDRLHLAAMEELSIRCLMTHDERQATAALEAGLEVLRPGATLKD